MVTHDYLVTYKKYIIIYKKYFTQKNIKNKKYINVYCVLCVKLLYIYIIYV